MFDTMHRSHFPHDPHRELRIWAEGEKLAWQHTPTTAEPKHYFFFDLNQGPLWMEPNPKDVLRLIQYSRKLVIDEGYGEHNALLQLVTPFKLIGVNSYTEWQRPYYTSALQERHNWISLAAWLASNGHIYRPPGP